MSFYTYAGEEDTCEECGKTFTHAPEYAYKAFFKKGKTYKLYYFCSWKCLQKYRRRKEENQEKPDHYENLGNGIYEVYVEKDGKVIPYAILDSETGEYHG